MSCARMSRSESSDQKGDGSIARSISTFLAKGNAGGRAAYQSPVSFKNSF
jgi:hypothetical protein